MNLEKAIEILTLSLQAPYPGATGDIADATRLSIEALKEVLSSRDGDPALDGELLPGETD